MKFYDARFAEISTKECRAEARENLKYGDETYFGRICDRCKCNLRFSKNRDCVVCHGLNTYVEVRPNKSSKVKTVKLNPCLCHIALSQNYPILTKHSDRAVRRIAAALKLETYEGIECSYCGGHTRYTNRGTCVPCVARRNAKHYEEKKRPAEADLNLIRRIEAMFD